MNKLEFLARDLPSPEAALRFFEQFSEKNPSSVSKLSRSEGLLSDVLALASYSPLLAASMIQSPDYVTWLAKERSAAVSRGKEELLESLARFALTNSQLSSHVLFARFRRRELMRIFLQDIRRLSTVAEITEQISNLADAILENALRIARQEMDNRFGAPSEVDEKGRIRASDICIVSLGKLGSKELNYSSDIDLLFIYSADGRTSGSGTRGAVTNREYFGKLAETVTQLVGKQGDEGAAYRVDLRLRPHGRVGALALSLNETVRYYLNDARSWEQQVLIRSRASAGNAGIYKDMFAAVEDAVFKPGRDAAEALAAVYRSKTQIDFNQSGSGPFNVKLGRGGIREIEFIAQALQLAHGGLDKWLRVPHTLISISRLADRGFLTESERSELSNAYDFLRRLEHILQMEHGLQTHSLPSDPAKLALVAAKMALNNSAELSATLTKHAENVHRAFKRVFAEPVMPAPPEIAAAGQDYKGSTANHREPELQLQQKTSGDPKITSFDAARQIAAVSPKFGQIITSRPTLAAGIKPPDRDEAPDYSSAFTQIDPQADRSAILTELRTTWSGHLLDIVAADICETISIDECRRRQTLLAEASIAAAINAAVSAISRRYVGVQIQPVVLALGKLGSGTLDYDSDLDLIIVYREDEDAAYSAAEVYSRMAELFVTFLSDMTRDGNLYRVDLRLRPYGKNGPNVTTIRALTEYIENQASVWELLAYIQMRAIGTTGPAVEAEALAREAISRRAASEDVRDIRERSREMRLRLEQTHGRAGSRDVDIKFGAGGLLDIYFVARFLQLVHPEVIGTDARSTISKLGLFHRADLLADEDYEALSDGHRFLSTLDHNIRLLIGRSSRFPRANQAALEAIATRMKLAAVSELGQQMAFHRMNIRAAFDNVLKTRD